MVAAFAVSVLVAIGAITSAVLIDRQKQDARAAYARARLALDQVSSKVIDDWLAKQPVLTDDQIRFLEQTLAHYEWLANRSEPDAQARAGVAAACMRAGDIRERLGQLAGAAEAYMRSIELYRMLANEFPDESAYRLALAKCERALGIILHRTDRRNEARAVLTEALSLHEQAFAESPADGEIRYELAGTLLAYGDFQRERGYTADAEKCYRRGLTLMEEASRSSAPGPLSAIGWLSCTFTSATSACYQTPSRKRN